MARITKLGDFSVVVVVVVVVVITAAVSVGSSDDSIAKSKYISLSLSV